MTQRLAVSHRTTYRYRRTVALSPHRLVLRPRSTHDLTVVDARLECSPDAAIAWTQDVFGNLVATATFSAPTDRLVIVNHVLVEQSATAWPVFAIDPAAHNYPFAYPDGDAVDLGALRLPNHADAANAIAIWARSFVAGNPTDTLSLLKDLNAGMLARVAYRVRDEEGTQSPQETLALASGSCRDIAALFIDAVRHLGFGARAVSGYLHDPDALPDHPGSTHAWAEVYLPAAGWIAFDPTHQRVGGAMLIPVAHGRSNMQIMPVTGGYAGTKDDFESMDVDVRVTIA